MDSFQGLFPKILLFWFSTFTLSESWAEVISAISCPQQGLAHGRFQQIPRALPRSVLILGADPWLCHSKSPVPPPGTRTNTRLSGVFRGACYGLYVEDPSLEASRGHRRSLWQVIRLWNIIADLPLRGGAWLEEMVTVGGPGSVSLFPAPPLTPAVSWM